MRLALVLLLLAAGVSFLGAHVNVALFERQDIVIAQRTREAPEAAHADAQAPRGAGDDLIASPPPLFRALQPGTEPAPASGERFELVGLAGQPGVRIAMLRDVATGASHNVRVNDEIGAWRIVEIEEHCVSLRRRRQDARICAP